MWFKFGFGGGFEITIVGTGVLDGPPHRTYQYVSVEKEKAHI